MNCFQSERSDTEVLGVDRSKWLKQSLLGISNTLDVVAIANVRRIVILERSSRNNHQYDISTTINIVENMKEDVGVLEVICIRLYLSF